MQLRKMSVAGSFYPDDETELKRYFKHFDKLYDENFTKSNTSAKIAIVPHAGYIYSGFTASVAYKELQNSSINTYVVIGPSHRVAFEGVSICKDESYETPLGEVKSDLNLVDILVDEFALKYRTEAHYEHSTETQFPFVKYYLPDARIVELVYSKQNPEALSQIIDFILEQKNYGVIISTDLSHFYNLGEAKKLDNICLNAISNLDVKVLEKGCKACGIIGVKAIIQSAKKLNMKYKLLDYRTSADFSKDESRVVGYTSGIFFATKLIK